MVSPEKALQILDNGDLQDIFLKYSFEEVHKVCANLSIYFYFHFHLFEKIFILVLKLYCYQGCPTRPRLPARLSLTAGTSRFWVERSLIGIASVVAIATISAILILCLISRNRVKNGP